MAREELISSADPSVASSPIEKRVAFLQAKNLTKEEIDIALSRAGEDSSAATAIMASSRYQPSSQSPAYRLSPPPPQGYGYSYPPYGQWQPPLPPPEPPRRDWRDWFIMATTMGGVGYGLYFVAKRYITPLIAPPTPPQLQQDKENIDEQFSRAFTLIEQLSTDTAALKSAEETRTERLDAALREVENLVADLKNASRRRDDETRRISDEVKSLKEAIPKALAGAREGNENRLKDLGDELGSLKLLLNNRLGGSGAATSPSTAKLSGLPTMSGASRPREESPAAPATNGTPAASTEQTLQPSTGSTQSSQTIGAASSSPLSQLNRSAAIPSWQLAAASRSKNVSPSTPSPTGDDSTKPASEPSAPNSKRIKSNHNSSNPHPTPPKMSTRDPSSHHPTAHRRSNSNSNSRARSRSPDRSDRHKRHRDRSHRHRHRTTNHDHRHPNPPKPILPFHARELSKRDLSTHQPMFAMYLDIQKGILIEDLPEDEVKGRWKSFTNKWNRGELAEGWYDPSTLEKARSVPLEAIGGYRGSPDYGRGDEQEEEIVDDEEDEYGPVLPGGHLSRVGLSGPTIPTMQDLELRKESAVEDALAEHEDSRRQHRAEVRSHRSELRHMEDEVAPRAEAGTHERRMEKRREAAAANRTFAEGRRGASPDGAPEDELMGSADNDLDAIKRAREKEQRKKNEREIRREEILRARAAEREERLQQYRQKEEKTIGWLKTLAKQRFG
ncbi:peroxisomal membrane anchor protein conserved region-domain-containing protein [Aspergillus coremiiformis]|uniref:Peroxisomal membrane protein PEX14 n=1 Tax=Aspergillus coremiiformis TaxID=138285 RepID=A0A5N6Z6J6_9EURO|nr:peroxisomal membrane anchor protein conserved region-domain-containing protein [Aspergillus coremiiformis]